MLYLEKIQGKKLLAGVLDPGTTATLKRLGLWSKKARTTLAAFLMDRTQDYDLAAYLLEKYNLKIGPTLWTCCYLTNSNRPIKAYLKEFAPKRKAKVILDVLQRYLAYKDPAQFLAQKAPRVKTKDRSALVTLANNPHALQPRCRARLFKVAWVLQALGYLTLGTPYRDPEAGALAFLYYVYADGDRALAAQLLHAVTLGLVLGDRFSQNLGLPAVARTRRQIAGAWVEVTLPLTYRTTVNVALPPLTPRRLRGLQRFLTLLTRRLRKLYPAYTFFAVLGYHAGPHPHWHVTLTAYGLRPKLKLMQAVAQRLTAAYPGATAGRPRYLQTGTSVTEAVDGFYSLATLKDDPAAGYRALAAAGSWYLGFYARNGQASRLIQLRGKLPSRRPPRRRRPKARPRRYGLATLTAALAAAARALRRPRAVARHRHLARALADATQPLRWVAPKRKKAAGTVAINNPSSQKAAGTVITNKLRTAGTAGTVGTSKLKAEGMLATNNPSSQNSGKKAAGTAAINNPSSQKAAGTAVTNKLRTAGTVATNNPSSQNSGKKAAGMAGTNKPSGQKAGTGTVITNKLKTVRTKVGSQKAARTAATNGKKAAGMVGTKAGTNSQETAGMLATNNPSSQKAARTLTVKTAGTEVSTNSNNSQETAGIIATNGEKPPGVGTGIGANGEKAGTGVVATNSNNSQKAAGTVPANSNNPSGQKKPPGMVVTNKLKPKTVTANGNSDKKVAGTVGTEVGSQKKPPGTVGTSKPNPKMAETAAIKAEDTS